MATKLETDQITAESVTQYEIADKIRHLKLQIDDLNRKIKDYEKKIAKITAECNAIEYTGCVTYDNRKSLTDIDDKARILNDMKLRFRKKLFLHQVENINSLFYHVDNIRYIYAQENIECPKWYVDKYHENLNI